LMTEFYRQLKQVPTKAEALRQAQLAMLRGQVKVEGQTLVDARGGQVVLPRQLANAGSFTHPYYWAAFTLVGSPW